MVQDGQNLPPEKKNYFNGFAVSITDNDVILILQNNGQPVAYLNTSHIIAKALNAKLQEIITGFEQGAEITIPVLEDLRKKLQGKVNANDSGNEKKD